MIGLDQDTIPPKEQPFFTSLGGDHINRFWKLFKGHGIVVEGHFLLTTGRHSSVYFDKDRLLANQELTVLTCREMVRLTGDLEYDVVFGPATGGIILAWEVARQRSPVTTPLYAVVRDGVLVSKGRTGQLVNGRKVLIVEDVITTGKTTREMIELARKLGSEVVGVASILNRGDQTAKSLNVPFLASVVTKQLPSWAPPCPKCEEGIPVETELGHGQSEEGSAFRTGAGP